MATESLTIRLDSDIKRDAGYVFGDMGMSLSTAINIFLREAIVSEAFPFPIRANKIPSHELREAMFEAEMLARDPNTKAYDSFEELLEDVKREMIEDGELDA